MNDKTTHILRRILAPLALIEWGAILIYFYFSQRLTAFLHPDFRPLVLLTGILLLVSAGCILFFEDDSSHGCDCDGCGTEHKKLTLGGLLGFAVLMLPIALAAKISPDSFGVGMVENRGIVQSMATTTNETPKNTSQESPIAPILAAKREAESPTGNAGLSVNVFDLMLEAGDALSRQEFTGKRVELQGQFFPGDPGNFGLVRTFVRCCAADAQMIGVRVDIKNPPNFTKLAWMKVIGRVSFEKLDEHDVPVVAAEQNTAIPAPKEPYIYGPSNQPKRRF